MHWIINEGLRRETSFPILLEHLEAHSIPYTLVRKPPEVGYLIAMHDDLDESGQHKPIMLDPIDGPVFVLGTTSMREVSEAHAWQPGFIDAPSQEECIENWGEHMLNAGARIGRLGTIEPPACDEFFIRPDRAGKAFSGTVLRAVDFENWRQDILDDPRQSRATAETAVIAAPAIPIWSEYRSIIVDGRFVTGSRYRTGKTWAVSPEVGNRIVRFVEERVAEWQPRRAICIDVADTPGGLKIIETNSVSSAGFYANDMRLFADAVDSIGKPGSA